MNNRRSTDEVAQPTTRPGDQASMRRAIRLLLADDHRMLREGLRRSMDELGFTVVGEARNGAEAVDLAAAVQPDVVLMDVTMPELDGVEATRQLKARLPGACVIMLTMHADQDVLAEAIRAGANGYLVKDCSVRRDRAGHRGRRDRRDGAVAPVGRIDVGRGPAPGLEQPGRAGDHRP